MRIRIAACLAAFALVAVVTAATTPARAGAQDKSKIDPPKHLYGHDLRVRKGGVGDFGPETPRVGVEFFRDSTTKTIIAISDAGSVAVTRAPTGELGKSEAPKWLTAHDLSCRKAGEPFFTQQTKKFGVELFQDRPSNTLLYVSDTGSVALAPVPGALVTDKGPKWHHGLEPKVRTPDQDKFDNAKKFGMEVFKDENTIDQKTSVLIYITEVGFIGTGLTTAPSERVKPPRVAESPTALECVVKLIIPCGTGPIAGI
ncbi:MAG: hypothetical protein K2V38_17980, partial [Gemmataceae bacterium]|nr:hypothetical protein [Gemmataceae bacterium]